MDKFDFSETREVLSVLNDQLSNYSLTLTTLTDTVIDEYVAGILTGTILVSGQIVSVMSTDTINTLGTMPAIVTDIKRLSSTTMEYTLVLLAGDLNGELVGVKFTNNQLGDAISISEDTVNVVNAIKSTMLGSTSFIGLKESLGITRFYTVNNGKLDSFM